LRVAPVEVATHAAHRCDDALAAPQVGARGVDDLAGALDPEHARELDRAPRAARAGDQLGAVEAERAHAHEHPAGTRFRDRPLLELEHLRSAWLMDDDREHAVAADTLAPRRAQSRRGA